MSQEVFILSARRTAIGAFQGVFAPLSAPQLGSVAAQAAVKDSAVNAELLDETIFGCVLSAGLGQAPARQAALGAGIPQRVPATTINKMCGSGMKALMLGSDQIRAGSAQLRKHMQALRRSPRSDRPPCAAFRLRRPSRRDRGVASSARSEAQPVCLQNSD